WPLRVDTTPEGAEIYATDYTDPKASDVSHWVHLGRTPLATSTLPGGYFRLRAVKDGFEPVESASLLGRGLDEAAGPLRLQLHTKDETPPGMVWLPPGFGFASVAVRLPNAPTDPVWIDKYEVSNRQFKAFVDAAGYQKREYWKQPFIRNGREVSWEEAIGAFR